MNSNFKILIIGDSFATDWSVKYNDYPGWPNLLSKQYNVTNLAQAGVSEYKIYRQLQSVADLDSYDLVIVSHTSPYRIYTRKNPVHSHDSLHANADLMLNDLSYHAKKIKNIFNSPLICALQFFKHHVDSDYLEIVYMLLREKINLILKNKRVIVISSMEHLSKFIIETNALDFSKLGATSPGTINHMSAEANLQIYQSLVEKIQQF